MAPEFDLHLYRSSSPGEGWVTTRLSVADLLPYHETGKTVTVGGEHGTVAWVDLWRSVILCDVLDGRPVLRDVPLPVPARGNWDRLLRDGDDPRYVRDVTISRRKDSIKNVEMEIRPPTKVEDVHVSYLEWVRGGSRYKVTRGGWKATAWSIPIPVGSWEDWRRECDVDVDDLTVDAGKQWLPEPLSSKLKGGDTEAILRRLGVSYPTISMDDDSVYLLSNVGELGVVVAVDVKKTLRGVAELDTQKNFYLMPSYCSSEISSYLKQFRVTLVLGTPCLFVYVSFGVRTV